MAPLGESDYNFLIFYILVYYTQTWEVFVI